MIARRVGVAATHAVDYVLAADLSVACVLKSMLTHRLPQFKTDVDRNTNIQKVTIRALSIYTGVYQASFKHMSSLSEVKTCLLAHPAAGQKWNLSGKSLSVTFLDHVKNFGLG